MHERIYAAAAKLIVSGKLATPITLREFFENAEPIATGLSVPQYLGRLAVNATSIMNVPDYARVIIDSSLRRALIAECELGAAIAYGSPIDADPLGQVADAQERLRDIQNRHALDEEIELEFASEVSTDAVTSYVIRGVVPSGSTALLYGPSGCGKTFLAIYFASCLARGADAFERRVQEGATLYVALEGQYGFGARIKAACASYGELGERVARLKTPIFLGTDPAGAAHVSRVIGAANQLRKRAGCPVTLIVIDTLACAMTTDNENDAAAISAVMGQVTRIKAETGAAVMLLHHPGKDGNRGLRGSSALNAAADVVIRIDREKGALERTVTIEKAKDGNEGTLGTFILNGVELGKDAEGDAISSCAVFPLVGVSHRRPRRPRSGTAADKALCELEELMLAESAVVARGHVRAPDGVRLVSKSAWRDACRRRQLSDGKDAHEKRAFNRAVQDLFHGNLAATYGDAAWMIDGQQGQKAARAEMLSAHRRLN